MTSKKFAIHVSGAPCSGKSTIATALAERFPGMYTVAYDNLKWHLSGYQRGRDTAVINAITHGLFEVVCKQGIPTVFDSFFTAEGEYMSSKKIAEDFGYLFISIRLTAPQEVLLERFRQRVASAKLANSKISVTDEALFLTNLSKQNFMPAGTPSFDTSVMSSAEIVEHIVKLIP